MKKIIFVLILIMFSFATLAIGYLSTIGYETDRFNYLLENKVEKNISNTKINLNKIKIKINLKNLSFFVTTFKPEVQYHENIISLKKIDAYINLKSLLIGNPKIDKINILSEEINIKEVKDIIKYSKPSTSKKFFLNKVEKGKLNFNLDLDLNDNQISDYEVNGFVKNFSVKANKIDLKNASFIYLLKEDSGEIDNLRALVNGFQINSGSIKFDNSKLLNIEGDLKSNLNLNKDKIEDLVKIETLKAFNDLEIKGNIQSLFKISFNQTLKVTDYQLEALGNISKSKFNFSSPKKYLFIKNEVNNIYVEKTEFKIDLGKDKKKILNLNGSYKVNNNSFQKFDIEHSLKANLQKLSVKGNIDSEIDIPFFNYNSKNKSININTELEIRNKSIKLKKFSLKEGKNLIDINNLILKNNRLVKFENMSIKTFANGKFNNDFMIILDKNIKVKGSKYDASNLTKLLEKSSNSNFLKNINKEISVTLKEISTNESDIISNFNLIGIIDNGKFNKIVSKGEFEDGKYLDISLRVDKNSKKKILEVYSDLPKPLLSNYNFFKGLSGGQLLLFSSYDSQNSNSNLTIENFKVKDAPDLVKLLSLADFGGMVDALSGDGLSFEKLEMKMSKNDQVLNLKELYAIGPSISILMEGYVESKTGLVSLRGTMVPAKTLNKFLSKLPLVGDILIPKEIGEGLFGISFKMKGTPGNIKTTVNPIKTLTPRFIQKALKKPK